MGSEDIAEKYWEQAVEWGGRRSDHIACMSVAMKEYARNQNVELLNALMGAYEFICDMEEAGHTAPHDDEAFTIGVKEKIELYLKKAGVEV